MQEKHTLGSYLKSARLQKHLSITEAALMVGADSPLQVMAWERNQGRALPLPVLKKLVHFYVLDEVLVLDLLLQYQMSRLEQKLNKLAQANRKAEAK